MTIRQGQSSFNIDDILNQKDIANKNTFRQYMDWRVIWAVLSLNENENLTYEGAGWTIESLYRLEAAWSYSLPHYTHIIFRDFEIMNIPQTSAYMFKAITNFLLSLPKECAEFSPKNKEVNHVN